MKKIGIFLYVLFRTFLAVMLGWTLLSYLINGAKMVSQTAWFENGLIISTVVAVVWAIVAVLPRREYDPALGLSIEDATPRKKKHLKLVD